MYSSSQPPNRLVLVLNPTPRGIPSNFRQLPVVPLPPDSSNGHWVDGMDGMNGMNGMIFPHFFFFFFFFLDFLDLYWIYIGMSSKNGH